MAKSNYDILQENKKEILAYASAVDKKPTFVPEIDKKKLKILSLFKNGDFSESIRLLDEIKDNKLGIVWNENNNLSNGTSVLVRDARNVTKDNNLLKQDAPEKYAMQIINQTRSSYDLIDRAGISEEAKYLNKRKITHIAENALNNMEKLGSSNIKNYNTQMIYVLDSAGINNAVDKLKFSTEISSLKDKHRHIVTLTSAKGPGTKDHR
jgi:hypothetical protein